MPLSMGFPSTADIVLLLKPRWDAGWRDSRLIARCTRLPPLNRPTGSCDRDVRLDSAKSAANSKCRWQRAFPRHRTRTNATNRDGTRAGAISGLLHNALASPLNCPTEPNDRDVRLETTKSAANSKCRCQRAFHRHRAKPISSTHDKTRVGAY